MPNISDDGDASSADWADDVTGDDEHSLDADISEWMDRLRRREGQAEHEMWQTYFCDLVALARNRLTRLPRREMDEEDIALSALHSFHRGVVANRFPQLTERENLWRILVTITLRKVSAQRRRHFAKRRGGGRVRGESLFQQHAAEGEKTSGIHQILGASPSPEVIAAFTEQCDLLFARLDEFLKPIALLKIEGYSNLEIAEGLDLALRTVERRLSTIRTLWTQALAELNDGPRTEPPV